MKKYLLLVVLLFCVTGVAYAATIFWQIPAQLNIVSTPPTSPLEASIELYTDPECTIEHDLSVNWGDVVLGATIEEDFYLKNEGGAPATVVMRVIESLDWGSWSVKPASAPMSPGDVFLFTLMVDVSPTAPFGVQAFTIEIYE